MVVGYVYFPIKMDKCLCLHISTCFSYCTAVEVVRLEKGLKLLLFQALALIYVDIWQLFDFWKNFLSTGLFPPLLA